VFDKLRKSVSNFVETLTKTELKGGKLDTNLWDFKLSLLENDVALPVADVICEDLKKRLEGVQVDRFSDPKELISRTLREILLELLRTEKQVDLLEMAEAMRANKKPMVLVFVGINGSGKTTTIAKVAHLLQRKGYSTLMACGDTFRAGSIEQLEIHAQRLGIPVIKHQYGSDAASVVYDAVTHARAQGINVVLADTAGRMQTNKNLMEEVRKVIRINNPDLTIFVGDSLAGNDALTQAEEFNRFVNMDASILTKIDADAKGGSSISISYVTKKPVIYLGNGQGYDDLIPFDPNLIVKNILGN
jgi:fused signal recognition particle receptor